MLKSLLNLDNIDVQLTWMHFKRATGGVFLKSDYVFEIIAVTVYTCKHFSRYSFLVRTNLYNNLTKR